MKKYITLFFCLLVIRVWAQKANRVDGLLDGYFTISSGLGIPVGNYGSNSVVNPNAYAASAGADFEINYMTRFSKHFGMVIMARSISVAHNITNSGGYFDGNNPNYMWNVETSPNKLKMAMTGLLASVALSENKKASLFFKPMLGASFVAQSTTTYNLIGREPKYNDGTIKITTDGQSYAFVFSFALGFKYNITPLFAFVAQMDYLSTNPIFNAQAVVATSSHIYTEDVTPYNLRMQMFTLNVGLALKVN